MAEASTAVSKMPPASTTTSIQLQTPHTIRLLKLIREGSSEYAEPAIVQLEATTVLANGSASDISYTPAQLWDLIGRLTAICCQSPTWATREMGALALQVMARHVPLDDQEQFLYHGKQGNEREVDDPTNPVAVTESSDTNSTAQHANDTPITEYDDVYFLKVSDLICRDEGGISGLDTVLEKGQTLWATAPSTFDIHVANTHSSVDESEGNDVEDDDDNSPKDHDTQQLGNETVDDYKAAKIQLQNRMRAQRSILARRLGLAALNEVIGDGDGYFVDQLLQDDEDNDPNPPSKRARFNASKVTSRKDRSNDQQPRNRDETTAVLAVDEVEDALALESSDNPGTLRALLVLQSRLHEQEQQRQQREQLIDDRSKILSPDLTSWAKGTRRSNNTNPQTLLATELIYRMMDPAWHVRHGAALGILALLRAWNTAPATAAAKDATLATSNTPPPVGGVGIWPEDILSRCLCLIALDKFGDFSGTALNVTASAVAAQADSASLSTSVVAPVREVVAQIVAVLWAMMSQSTKATPDSVCPTLESSENIKRETLTVLHRLCGYESEWEVRHGALLALKYVVVVIATGILRRGSSPNSSTESSSTGETAVVSLIASIATDRLSDSSDDVKSVAAQVLIEIGRHYVDVHDLPEFLWRSVPHVWTTLSAVRKVASCVVDLVALLAMYVQRDAPEFLRRIHDNADATNKLESGGCAHDGELSWDEMDKVIECMLGLFDSDFVSVRVAALRSIGALCSSILTAPQQLVTESFFHIVERTFELFFRPWNDSGEQSGGFASRSLLEEVWRLVVEAIVHLAMPKNVEDTVDGAKDSSPNLLSAIICRLLASYFNVDRSRAAEAIYDISGQVAAADALSALLMLAYQKQSSIGSLVQAALVAFFHSVWTLQVEAACLLYRALQHRLVRRSSLEMFENLLDPEARLKCLEQSDDASNSDDADVWRIFNETAPGSILSFDIQESVLLTVMSSTSLKHECISPVAAMRVRTTVAGAVLSKGLPSKVTPLIRSLMTSFNNEAVAGARTDELCRYLKELLELMKKDATFDRGFNKVVATLCDAAIQDSNAAQPGSPRQYIARSVLQSLVQSKPNERPMWADAAPLQQRLSPLSKASTDSSDVVLEGACTLLQVLVGGLVGDQEMAGSLIEDYVPTLVELACSESGGDRIRKSASWCLEHLAATHAEHVLRVCIPMLAQKISNQTQDKMRSEACGLLEAMVRSSGTAVRHYVRCLLPLVLSLVTDSVPSCAQRANCVFAALVRLAPLVGQLDTSATLGVDSLHARTESVIDHLIFGKPLPPCEFPKALEELHELKLRSYQKEGVAWLHFLWCTNLAGALCDDMGLGKSIQALVAVALAHHDCVLPDHQAKPVSLVICPSSLVGHWKCEVEKHFPAGSTFDVLALVGSRTERLAQWNARSVDTNIVIISYGVLRCDIDYLEAVSWCYCILDEGHLLKNPKTATAQASRRLRARSKLVLTGTPIQNRVYELWATFDFLMPNFLGTSAWFMKDFAGPIGKSQLPGACAKSVANGIAKLKQLHQQVLPFILRREKDQVLPELPATTLTIVRVAMSGIQQSIYDRFGSQEEGTRCRDILEIVEDPSSVQANVSTDVLKSLLFLRLVCTHPSLVLSKSQREVQPESLYTIGASGKMLALAQLLREAGMDHDDLTGADNDTSLLYCEDEAEDHDAMSSVLELPEQFEGNLVSAGLQSNSTRKCLIFAQFSKSLDAVEDLVFKAHMPSLQYLRIDGTVPASRRTTIVARFATDPLVRVMLLTTRVGGLGLNLTAASLVIFLESDLNPFADIQAQDRCRRIGQTKQVDVYKLVTKDSIEESIVVLQEKKKKVAESVVNTENSTMYSMGTDRLLDIFSLPGAHGTSVDDTARPNFDLDGFVESCAEDYKNLSVTQFTEAFAT